MIVLYRTICLKYPPPSYQNVLLLTRREIGGIKDAFQKVDCSNAILKFLKQQFFKYALNQRGGGVFKRGKGSIRIVRYIYYLKMLLTVKK